VDIRHFLDQRLAFINQLYVNSAAPFIECIRKIEAGEEPFVPPYSEDPEPAFLSEWREADESLQVLGRSCISMLSSSFHLYFKTLEKQLGVPVNDSYKSLFKKQGWFNGYRAYFLRHFNVKFEDSLCNLVLLEELVLARNRVQHPDSISTHSSHYSKDDLKKLPKLFFISDHEYELFGKTEAGELEWLMPPTIHVTSEKFLTAVSEVARFAEWIEKS
jgi:hypothetical protein